MASRFTSRFISRLLQNRNPNFLHSNHRPIFTTIPNSSSISSPTLSSLFHSKFPPSNHRFFSTARRHPNRQQKLDIGARARQMQTRRLWTYAITFSCIAGFIIIVLNQFEDQLVFYVTPTDALTKYSENPSKNKFRLGGLVLEGSVAHPASSHEIEFVITDLITDMLVRYEGQVPDLLRVRCRRRVFPGRRGVSSVIFRRVRFWRSMMRSICRRKWRMRLRRIRRSLWKKRVGRLKDGRMLLLLFRPRKFLYVFSVSPLQVRRYIAVYGINCWCVSGKTSPSFSNDTMQACRKKMDNGDGFGLLVSFQMKVGGWGITI
uniref:Putative ccmE/CycJ protein n=1 Tax=Helianthus annuus TaxID=4232 RepID=A0A251RKL2_HELAN